jgi:hypothetical protein
MKFYENSIVSRVLGINDVFHLDHIMLKLLGKTQKGLSSILIAVSLNLGNVI